MLILQCKFVCLVFIQESKHVKRVPLSLRKEEAWDTGL
uniref:Uncharacterized protein n=1 Tax=Anguilla anguilla TaxID=7936 RepID=A0A0E9PI54_ANGAN